MSPLVATYANASAQGYGAFSTIAAAGDYESIATVTVGSGGAANVEFTSIPSTYTHLQIRGMFKVSRTTGNGDAKIVFNSDTGNNYTYHRLTGDGSSASSSALSSTSNGIFAYPVGNYANVNNVFTGFVCDILDYANTNKYKTVRTLSGTDQNGLTGSNGDGGNVRFVSNLWQNTNAITSIQLIDPSYNFQQYSHFALYGIKSA